MALSATQTIDRNQSMRGAVSGSPDHAAVLRRLDTLLAANAETLRSKRSYRSDQEKFEAGMMRHPIGTQKAFAFFGLMLGTYPPAAVFARFLVESNAIQRGDAWWIGVLLIVNIVTAVVGYFSGKLIGRMVASVENYRWPNMIALLPLIGALWGIMAGGAGGFVIFVIGSLIGAVIGGMVGAAAVPMFAMFHRLLKRGDSIETKHFLPLAFGITLAICAFIVGR